MKLVTLVLVLLVVGVVALAILKKRGGSAAGTRPWPYYAIKTIFALRPAQLLNPADAH